MGRENDLNAPQPNCDNLMSHVFSIVTNMSHVRLEVSFTIRKFGCGPSNSVISRKNQKKGEGKQQNLDFQERREKIKGKTKVNVTN